MTLTSLQALTWGTVTGAVLSAVLLASGESALPDWSRLKRTEPGTRVNTEPPSVKAKQRSAAAAPAAPNAARNAGAR